MATAIRNVGSSVTASSVSPTDKAATGNDVDNLSVFQLFDLLSDPRNASQNAGLMNRIYNAPPDAELVKLNPQALDLLNGIAPSDEEPTQLSLSLYLPPQRNPQAVDSAPLTSLQMEVIASIVAEYANRPFTLSTALQMQKEFAEARIDTRQLSLKTLMQIAYSADATTYTEA